MDSQIRAAQAKQLLDNDVFKEALRHVTDGINREMDTVKPDDTKTMQSLVLTRQAANRIIKHIMLVAEDNDSKVTQFNAKKKRFSF